MKGMIDWFARNRVAANPMMAFILASGVLAAVNSNEEVFSEMASAGGGLQGARGPLVRYHREMVAAARRRPVPAARRRTATAGGAS